MNYDSIYWLELLSESGIVSARKLEPLQNETAQLLAIFTTIAKKTKRALPTIKLATGEALHTS